jgi:hypothetical protein
MISKSNIKFELIETEGRKSISYQLQSSLSSFALRSVLIAFLLSAASATHAVTTRMGTNNVYQVDESVYFKIGDSYTEHFTFTWEDPGSTGNFPGILDPTLYLSAGQTYRFQRVTSGHNFVLLHPTFTYMIGDEQQGYYRNTTSDAFITNHTLGTASYGGGAYTWTPTALDVNRDFWYTCQVAGHQGMAGKITVIPEPSTLGLAAAALLGLALVKQRSRRTKGPGLGDRSGSASQS